MFQKVHTHKRREIDSKHHAAVKEFTLEQQRFDQTEITRKKVG